MLGSGAEAPFSSAADAALKRRSSMAPDAAVAARSGFTPARMAMQVLLAAKAPSPCTACGQLRWRDLMPGFAVVSQEQFEFQFAGCIRNGIAENDTVP